jgi:hypothetical protein
VAALAKLDWRSPLVKLREQRAFRFLDAIAKLDPLGLQSLYKFGAEPTEVSAKSSAERAELLAKFGAERIEPLARLGAENS